MTGLVAAVQGVMSRKHDGVTQWWTMEEIQKALQVRTGKCVGIPTISARIRDLRKPQFGGHTVHRRPVAGKPGLYQYRLELR